MTPPKGVSTHSLRTTAVDLLPPEYKNPLITLLEAQDPIIPPSGPQKRTLAWAVTPGPCVRPPWRASPHGFIIKDALNGHLTHLVSEPPHLQVPEASAKDNSVGLFLWGLE